MSESDAWKASRLEQRMAWGVAACCIILVLLASTLPEWFEFSEPGQRQATRQPETTQTKHPAAYHRKAHAHQAHTKMQLLHSKPKKASTPADKAATLSDGFYVQVGAFQERPRARGLADLLKRHGWHVEIIAKPGGLHAVWVGPKKTHSEAETLLKAIQRKHKNKGFIVHQK